MFEKHLYQPIIRGGFMNGIPLWRVADSANIKQPFDICGVVVKECHAQGMAVGIEVKRVKRRSVNGNRPAWSSYENHQKAWLAEYGRALSISLAIECYDDYKDVLVAYLIGEYDVNGIPKVNGVFELKKSKDVYDIGWIPIINVASARIQQSRAS